MRLKSPLAWIELSRSALYHNLNHLKQLAGNRLLAVSVKANAYGHGLEAVVSMLTGRSEVDYLTVHSVDEALRCRQAGWTRKIMLLGPASSDQLPTILEHNLEPVIFNRDILAQLGRLGEKAGQRVLTHLKLETGTNRQGIAESDLPGFASVYKKYGSLRCPLGASMHFANIEDTTRHEFAQSQLARFKQMLKKMAELGIKPRIRHTAASAAMILFEKTRFELVRPGISVYGHWPSKETYLTYRLQGGQDGLLRPVLAWRTRITQVKKIPSGSFVGYGCTYRTTNPARLAVLPIGYADGYDRLLSNRAHVLIHGQRAPVRGRVCMNLTLVDISLARKARLGDEATLIGRDSDEILSAETLADWAQTINYEILARLSNSINRIICQ